LSTEKSGFFKHTMCANFQGKGEIFSFLGRETNPIQLKKFEYMKRLLEKPFFDQSDTPHAERKQKRARLESPKPTLKEAAVVVGDAHGTEAKLSASKFDHFALRDFCTSLASTYTLDEISAIAQRIGVDVKSVRHKSDGSFDKFDMCAAIAHQFEQQAGNSGYGYSLYLDDIQVPVQDRIEFACGTGLHKPNPANPVSHVRDWVDLQTIAASRLRRSSADYEAAGFDTQNQLCTQLSSSSLENIDPETKKAWSEELSPVLRAGVKWMNRLLLAIDPQYIMERAYRSKLRLCGAQLFSLYLVHHPPPSTSEKNSAGATAGSTDTRMETEEDVLESPPPGDIAIAAFTLVWDYLGLEEDYGHKYSPENLRMWCTEKFTGSPCSDTISNISAIRRKMLRLTNYRVCATRDIIAHDGSPLPRVTLPTRQPDSSFII